MLNENAQIRRIAVKRPAKLTEAGVAATEAMQSGVLDTYSLEKGPDGMIFVISSKHWSAQSETIAQALTSLLA